MRLEKGKRKATPDQSELESGEADDRMEVNGSHPVCLVSLSSAIALVMVFA